VWPFVYTTTTHTFVSLQLNNILMSLLAPDACQVCPMECGGFTAENPSVSCLFSHPMYMISPPTFTSKRQFVPILSVCVDTQMQIMLSLRHVPCLSKEALLLTTVMRFVP
jgi:hypothetical protein